MVKMRKLMERRRQAVTCYFVEHQNFPWCSPPYTHSAQVE